MRQPTAAGSATRSISRALDILEVLSACPVPQRLSALASKTGFAKSTVYRILTMLISRDFVSRIGKGYVLGPSALLLANDVAHPERMQQLLTPFLLELHERTYGAVSVGVLCNGRVLCSHGLYRRGYPTHPQPSVPVLCTAVGKLLLAYTSSEAQRFELTRLGRAAEGVMADAEALRLELAGILRMGMAYSNNADTDEIEVAAPVFAPHNQVVGIRVTAPFGMLDPRTSARHVVESARAASAYLSDRHATGSREEAR